MRLRQPIWSRFLTTKIVLSLARVGPLGKMRKAPGTWGSLGGLLYQLLIFHTLQPLTVVVFSLLGLWFAIGICGEAEFRLGKRDPGEVVLDEFVVMPLCFIGWTHIAAVLPGWASPWTVYVAGFALFRLFDILKPFGISKLQDLEGGWGVVMDDVAAALASCAVMHVAAASWLYFSHG
ncbi:MAG: phosphatidylglycerophosphatase A [Nibricoccus sp.]